MKKNKEKKECISGNEAAAHAVRLAGVQVVAAYPITPATTIPEKITEFSAKGLFDGHIKLVESEHSAMAACIGAAMTEARTFTATSSQGLLYMTEMIHWAAGSRLPIVMVNANRAICSPWALWSDMNDSMSVKDSGWMQFYCEDAQEVLDSILIAYKLSERLLIPSMICYEGFLVSHASEPVIIPNQADVNMFLPLYDAKFKLDLRDPHSFGNLLSPADFTEIKHNFHNDMASVVAEAKKISKEFKSIFGRKRGMVFDVYSTGKAQTAIVAIGSMFSTIKETVKGYTGAAGVDVIKLKMFRPFPKKELLKILSKYKEIIVIDRNLSCGQGGQIWIEIRSLMCGSLVSGIQNSRKIFGYVVGLNGIDITPDAIRDIVSDSWRRKNDLEPVLWGVNK